MSFEGHPPTGADPSHGAELRSSSSPGLSPCLLALMDAFLFLPETGRNCPKAQPSLSSAVLALSWGAENFVVCGFRGFAAVCRVFVSLTPAPWGAVVGSAPSLKCGPSDVSPGFSWAGEDVGGAREAELI